MPATAPVMQMAINPKMPRINHPMNHLDSWSTLACNWEASPAMGPSSQGYWRSTGIHRPHRDGKIKRDSFFREIEELRQVCNMQSIQLTEYKVY